MNTSGFDPRVWFAQLAPRERSQVLLGGLVAAALILAGVAWRLHAAVGAAERRIATRSGDLALMQAVAPQVQASQASAGRGDEPLALLIDRSAREAGLDAALAGTEPAGPTAVRVRLNAASFDALVAWLGALQSQYGVEVRTGTIERAEAVGTVDASFMLARS
jgi:general secretion pathway protein M